jgi:hypothetical protein
MSAEQRVLNARQSHRRARHPSKRRLGASEIVAEFLNETEKGGPYEISSFDCYFDGIDRHGDSNVAGGRLLQGQREMLPWQML